MPLQHSTLARYEAAWLQAVLPLPAELPPQPEQSHLPIPTAASQQCQRAALKQSPLLSLLG